MTTPKIVIHTQADKKLYNFFPIVRESICFSVKTTNDIHVALTLTPEFNPVNYEIVIGGGENSWSSISKNGNDVVTIDGKHIYTEDFGTYWIRFADNFISVGKGDEDGHFMQFYDTAFIPMRYFGLATGFGAEGEWHIDTQLFRTPYF